jgi:hypothetical protein
MSQLSSYPTSPEAPEISDASIPSRRIDLNPRAIITAVLWIAVIALAI